MKKGDTIKQKVRVYISIYTALEVLTLVLCKKLNCIICQCFKMLKLGGLGKSTDYINFVKCFI